jgi:hypothetical protein
MQQQTVGARLRFATRDREQLKIIFVAADHLRLPWVDTVVYILSKQCKGG